MFLGNAAVFEGQCELIPGCEPMNVPFPRLSCLSLQIPVTFEDVTVHFTLEEWDSLLEWQQALYLEVMEANFELVASLVQAGSVPHTPELIGKTEQGDEPWAPGPQIPGSEEDQGNPGSGHGGGAQEVRVKEEPGLIWDLPSSSSSWGSLGCSPLPLALCPSWCQVKLTDVRSLSPEALLEATEGSNHQAQLLICRECGKSCADEESLRWHQWMVHEVRKEEEDEEEEEEEENEEGAKEVVDRKGPFACTSCGKVFVHRRNLLAHKKHRSKRRHDCVQCGAHFCLRGDLLRHRGDHAGEGPHPCGTCSLVFQHKRHLDAHKAEEHSAAESEPQRQDPRSEDGGGEEGDRPFDCPTCGERFSWRESLQIHQSTHRPEQAFQCALCGRSFSRRRNLLAHQRIHTGDRPFACLDCGRRFVTNSGLAGHARLHRRQQPFLCRHCGRRFRHREKLLEHQAAHVAQAVEEEPET
uniref:Uncharacterized protein n=1 Tax=Anolis carolinensis TaxID=28377 RepID=A0A803TGU3_ANOCA